ncbi:E3 ubiquitin-protein ligase TRIM32 [Dissostichus eleginoides]|uniref:E3 ubiquitin-protein ligase TRIM32 n=1 Tax=Dissostichus eleginoides TaxID=100907 RepID=A0AAD9B6Q9_DISEL|nr:E3 ubiquitin-protein ligase TRIM32 [Dissostichus eleginoides]
MRVVRKLRLSSSTENEEDLKSPTLKSPIPRHRGASESSQDEDVESLCSDTQGQDLFNAIPPVSSQGESEGDESDSRHNGTKRRSTLKGKRRQKALVLVSCEEPSCPTDAKSSYAATSPKTIRKGSPSRYSLVDHPLSQRNLTKKKTSNQSSMDSGSPPSPVDSEDSSYIYTVNIPSNESLNREHYRSMSTTDLSALGEVEEEEGGSTALDSAYLVKQFGKQGSGRTDFNLPSGVHTTIKGQLFVVDCGNARIQVTDLQKNVVQQVTPSGSERSSRICNYFDVAVNSKGLIALTCAAERAVLVFNRHGRLLQTFGGTLIGATNEELDAPRGVTVTRQDEFLVADLKRGTLTSLKLDPKTGARLERTVVTGYHRPYLVAACLTTGFMAVSERGNETGRVPCIRVLEPGWNTIRILGVCSGLGPVLTFPWGLCIDSDGDVLVADWGKQHHRVLIYPPTGVGWPLVNDSLSSPRGLALLPDGHMVVSDSMNHCIKIYHYK